MRLNRERGAVGNMAEEVEKGKLETAKDFLSESHAELKKVTWPTREQTIKATWVVIIMVIIISIYLGLVDYVLAKLVRYIMR